jgi:pimeloyl-ACP methyl ester carboxylesterase
MAPVTDAATRLAYDDEGAGTPVVLLHGLTFDRRTWRPIVERLGGGVRTIAVDLPAHGDSAGEPAPLEDVATLLYELVTSLSVERPIVVGHSMSGGLACLYASTYPTRGIVVVDSGPEIGPFAELAQRLEPVMRGSNFAGVWRTFEDTLGLERIPEPRRSFVLDTHQVQQDVVLGYWDMLLHSDPAELEAWIDSVVARIDVPCWGVFGRPVTDVERERLQRLPDVRLDEWIGDGHFVHLVDPDRFTTQLRRFVDYCAVKT